MQATIQLPRAFSVRDYHEFYPIQHLVERLNPRLRVAAVATGVHINGGCTVFWGITYLDTQAPSRADVEAALRDAGFDFSRGGALNLTDVSEPVAE